MTVMASTVTYIESLCWLSSAARGYLIRVRAVHLLAWIRPRGAPMMLIKEVSQSICLMLAAPLLPLLALPYTNEVLIATSANSGPTPTTIAHTNPIHKNEIEDCNNQVVDLSTLPVS